LSTIFREHVIVSSLAQGSPAAELAHRQLIESSPVHPIVSAGLRAVEMQSNTSHAKFFFGRRQLSQSDAVRMVSQEQFLEK
jgi:hypothetical protein